MARSTRRALDAEPGKEASIAGSPAKGKSEPDGGQTPPEPTEIVQSDEQWAGHLRESIPALFMHTSMNKPFKTVEIGAYKLYRDGLLADCGNPTDPIEIMVIEQLALAHFNMGLLQCRAANATQVEATNVYASAAARLMGEFRRSALALQAYRAASRQLAHDPSKDLIIPAEADSPDGSPGKICADGQLIATTEVTDANESIIPYSRPEAVGNQPPQSPEVARHEPRRKGKGSRRDSDAPAMGEVHRAANG
jgi:hypothetical protein